MTKFKGVELISGSLISVNGNKAAFIALDGPGIWVIDSDMDPKRLTEDQVEEIEFVLDASEAVPLHSGRPDFVHGTKVTSNVDGNRYCGIILAAFNGVVVALTDDRKKIFHELASRFELIQ